MAIMTPGVAIGQISGRVGGSVFSHNRGGAYLRNGSIPSIVQTQKAIFYKSALALASNGWANLTVTQRQAWIEYAATHPVTNRLGRSHNLTGINWYVACNSRLLAASEATIDLPPSIPAPVGTLITSLAVDVSDTKVDLVLTTDPLGANSRAWIRGARVSSAGVSNVRNKLTEIKILAAAATGTIDLYNETVAALGDLQAGDWFHLEVRVMDDRTGLISGASMIAAECTA